ncbi:hypothetical protein D8B26_004292 [Coccidioides posadasii str. Silveira]|uniref:Uncharacterized protein n=2 Tax=Coccidioides posadasii TaxID=199306 RepID=E9DCI1_COCPS|nr:TPR Domain containing protein [Coccidioides posadasii C735 delta SOWgp]EER22999.1 TPR Domain containing protein [Coccidioides posadasii C735 delta SOWgp]EFW15906.1 conserved hypothetical protein [Coccidioides posadasii str. Silveira]QVM09637.1 hypothetical protein D8B26_004292 [Coccidioides posadasii str. Silveira]|eukprot:XP_003065144.1 TPR Domain containing protein [Coccidioides posadasii C735 delta SOWgp]
MRKLFGIKKKDERSSRHSLAGPPPSSFNPQANSYASTTPAQQFTPGSQPFHQPQTPQQYAPNRHSYAPPSQQQNQYQPPIQSQPAQARPGEPFRSQGDDLSQRGDYNGAAVMYEAALRVAPNDISLLLSRTMALSMTNPPRLDLALKDADTVIQLDPRSWQGWLEKGRILSRMGDLQAAEEALTNAVGFASDYGRNVAQSALADVRARRAQFSATTTTTSSPALTSTNTTPPTFSSPPAPPPPPPLIDVTAPTESTTTNLPLRPAQTPQPTTTSTAALSSASPAQTTQQPSAPTLQPINANSAWTPSSPGRATTPRPNVPNESSSNTTSQSARTNTVNRPANNSHMNPGFNDLLNWAENTPSEAPPAYSRNLSDPAQLQRQMDELTVALRQKNKGALSISPYTLSGNIDAIRLLYMGLAQADLTPREYGAPTYLHPSYSMMAVGSVSYPGSTFLDMDCETSGFYEGKYPATITISGYSEEYRAHQLLQQPILKLSLESEHLYPEVPLGKVVERLRKLRNQPSLEDDEGLKNLLNLSQTALARSGFQAGGSRQTRISFLCMTLTRSLHDASTRFIDTSKERFFCNHIFNPATTGIGMRNFLFQMLIGAEILIRLRKETTVTNYAGIVTDPISATIVLAALWMENVVIQGPKAGVKEDEAKAWSLYASQNQRQAEALIRFAEAMEWPYMDEFRSFIEGAYDEIISAKPVPSWDIYDWLYGLVLPGKIYRHRVMSCLVHSSATIKSFSSAPYWDNGIIVKDKSYWPRRTVLGRVLGGLKDVKSVCGWIGPAPAPVGNLSGWIRLKTRNVSIPVPVSTGANNRSVFQSLGFEEPDGRTESVQSFLKSFTDPDEWIEAPSPTPPRPYGALARVKFKDIQLTLLPNPAAASTTRSDLPPEEYRASLDFEVDGRKVTCTLYSNPVFVAAPPCVGSHVIHKRQADKYQKNVIKAADIKNKYPPANQLIVIDAMGPDEEVFARAWCAETGRHALVRKGDDCCYPCAVSVATERTGLGINVVIMC